MEAWEVGAGRCSQNGAGGNDRLGDEEMANRSAVNRSHGVGLQQLLLLLNVLTKVIR